jgi:hypothetical protein
MPRIIGTVIRLSVEGISSVMRFFGDEDFTDYDRLLFCKWRQATIAQCLYALSHEMNQKTCSKAEMTKTFICHKFDIKRCQVIDDLFCSLLDSKVLHRT